MRENRTITCGSSSSFGVCAGADLLLICAATMHKVVQAVQEAVHIPLYIFMHHIIFEELAKGIISPQSRTKIVDMMANLRNRGAEGIILGCTEISLVIKPNDINLPPFDTTQIHTSSAITTAMTFD